MFWCVLIRAGALGGQKHQLQAIVSLPVWVLRAWLKSSVTLICALNWWAISTPHSFAPASHGLVIWLQFCCGNWTQDGQTIGSYCLPMAYYPSHKLAYTPEDGRDTGQFSLVLRYSEHPVQTPHQEGWRCTAEFSAIYIPDVIELSLWDHWRDK